MIGVYDHNLSRLIAEVLQEFGLFQVMVVSGENGLDEMNICGKTYVVELNKEKIEEYEVMPEDVGLSTWPVEDLIGGDAEKNKKILLQILDGVKGAPRDVTIFNAAAALKVTGIAKDLNDGVKKATAVIDNGLAKKKLQEMIEVSRKL